MKWICRKRREEELDEEIQAHLAIEAKQRMDAGEPEYRALEAARHDFGNMAQVKEVTRSMWRFNWFDSLAQDFRYACRGMRKSPGFSIVVVLILALGIGANTAIFGVVNAALLRPLPFENPDRLVRILATRNGAEIGGPSVLDVRDFSAASQSFESMVVYDRWRKNVSGIQGSNYAEEMIVGLVPGAYFDLLRVNPILGRVFSAEESRFGKHFVAAIGQHFWQTRFQSDPAILGKTLRLNSEPYTIVAVMPDVIPAWMDTTAVPISVWTPFAPEHAYDDISRGDRGNYALGRLKPGVTVEQASSELTNLAARLAQRYQMDLGIGAALEPLADTRSGPVRPILLLLSAAVGMVLVIACANLAGLLLARNSARSREMAVRAALGASRGRMIRQLLIEASVISLMGGAAGVAFSSVAGFVLSNLNAGRHLPYTTQSTVLGQYWSATPEPRVLLFSLAISLLTAFLFGVVPAFTGTRVSLAGTLREAGRGSTAGSARQRLRRLLVVTEIALSLVLVVAATLLVQAMIRLQRQDPGFRQDHLLLAHVYIPPARYKEPDAITRFCDAFSARLRSLPGVADASMTTGFPPTIGWRQVFTVPGAPVVRLEDTPSARFAAVDTHYLRTLGIPFRAGRDFTDADSPTSPVVAIVNEQFVHQYFPGKDPVGRTVHQGPPPGLLAPSLQSFGGGTRDMTIVGVVRDFINNGVGKPPAPQIFMLFRQQPSQNFGFKDVVVRTAVNPEGVVPALTRELKALDAH